MRSMIFAYSLLLALCGPAWAGDELVTIKPATRPKEDLTLGLVRRGLVAEVRVKEGDAVTAGQVIVQLDDSAERAQLEQYKEEAENNTRIQAAEAKLAQSRVILERTEQVHAGGAATDLELAEAKLSVLIQELTVDLARFEQAQARRKYEETRLLIERMQLRSPIDGRVERIVVKEGEAVEELEKIVRVVRIDPLWIDVPVPLAAARDRLQQGQAAVVVFENADGSTQEVEGYIYRIALVADSASETLNVRVEVPNTARRPAGEHVMVRFPAAAVAAGANVEP